MDDEVASETPGPLILVVDDEPLIRHFIRSSLATRGYRAVEAETGREGIALARQRVPDLILLDVDLPDLDGVSVTVELRAWTRIPIIIVSSLAREPEKVRALDAGANDYIVKPFGLEELLARIRVHLRPAVIAPADPVFTSGPLTVDRARRQVTIGSQRVKLTALEYKLLDVLVENAGRVVPHDELLQRVWGPSASGRMNYLRVHMSHLRSKMRVSVEAESLIETESKQGYRLLLDHAAAPHT